MSDIDTGVVVSLKVLDPDGRLEKRTNRRRLDLSALCQKRSFALQQKSSLFNHLVGARLQCQWHRQAAIIPRYVSQVMLVEGYPGGRGPLFNPRLTSCCQASSAFSTYEKRSRSAGAIIPSSTSVRKLMTRVQYDWSTITTGMGGIL